MTDARATQIPVLTLFPEPPAAGARATQVPVLSLTQGGDARATQVAVLTLFPVRAHGLRLTQGPVLSLVQNSLGARATQLPVLSLVRYAPCLTHWAMCWRIERMDGVVFNFTSHDLPLPFRGETYQPCDSLSTSAAELGSVLGQVGNAELAGIISDDAIKDADLLGGLFDNAIVDVWVVPWDGSSDPPWRLMTGTTGRLTQTRDNYSMEVLTTGAALQRAAMLQIVAPSCRWKRLGDERCGLNLAPFTVTGSVTAVPTALDASRQADRRFFQDSTRAEADGYFAQGSLTWLTGANAGVESEVKDFVAATGQFTLWQPLLNPIQVGDTYEAVAGCDRRAETCQSKFNNYDNFGGFKDVPGNDAIRATPDAKG